MFGEDGGVAITFFSALQQYIVSPSSEADVWHKCEELLAKTSPLQPKFVHYQYPEGRTKLPVDRHESYLWLLNLACQVGGCQMIALDKMVIRLSQIFVLLSEGKATEGLICTKFGLRQKK